MIIKEKEIKDLLKLIDNEYESIIDVFLPKDKKKPSIFQYLYYHSFLEESQPLKVKTSKSLKDRQTIAKLPIGEAHDYSISRIEEQAMSALIKNKEEFKSKVAMTIRDFNDIYKIDALQDISRSDKEDQKKKEEIRKDIENAISEMKTTLDYSINRILITESSNAIGIGAVDRIITNNKSTPTQDIYVYRTHLDDSSTCRFCKKFYIDSDGTPKVYRLSDILANGTNFGLQQSQWKPVLVSTHPMARDNPFQELKPGFRVLASGGQSPIDPKEWDSYIKNKVQK